MTDPEGQPTPKRYVTVKNFPTRDRLYVDGDVAEVIREYIEPASEWSGKPEIPMLVAVNSKWAMPLHLQPHQFEEASDPSLQGEGQEEPPNPSSPHSQRKKE